MLVRKQLEVGTWTCCSGHIRMAAHGMLRHAGEQQKEVTLSCCSGHGRRGVLGMQKMCVIGQLLKDMWRLCSG
jgi:hypothetical protein